MPEGNGVAGHAVQLLKLILDALLKLTVPARQLGRLLLDRVVVPLDSNQGAYPGQQLGLVERLVDEVVGAGLDGADLLLFSARSDHDHRQESRPWIFADPAADLVPIHSRHQDVQQNEVWALLAQHVQGFLSGGRRGHPESLRRQHRLEQADVWRQIIHDEYERIRCHSVPTFPSVRKLRT